MTKYKNIEPFPLYPESIINSKEKAKKVIELNNYYFNVVGVLSVILGGVIIYNYTQDREMLALGLSSLLCGVIYISLSFFARKFQSRIACVLLLVFLFSAIGSELLEKGIDAINGLSFIQSILAAASYRMTKAVFYYNKEKF